MIWNNLNSKAMEMINKMRIASKVLEKD